MPLFKNRVKRNPLPALSILLVILFLFTAGVPLISQDRIPRPEFETNYQLPEPTVPPSNATVFEYIDIGVLTGALTLASLIALKWRSRRAMFLLMVFSLIYFGFYRKGGICPVSSIQNVALAAFNPSYNIPVKAVAYFALPLVFTLFFGRTFCAGVCPIGAIQDLFILWPVRVPDPLERALGTLPYFHLSLAVLFAATDADFIISRFHPFAGFFRFAASFNMLLFGASFLAAGMFIARPYCRYLCPYVVLLKWMSRFSRWHLTITPDECIQCKLCEDSCPFGAIRTPTPDEEHEKRAAGVRRLLILFVLLPVLIFAGGWSWSKLHRPFSLMHRSVRLAEQVRREDLGISMKTTLESEAFRKSGTPPADLYKEALEVKGRYLTGGWISGGFLGLVFAITLIDLSVRKRRKDYIPDRASCFSCGRCMPYCPKEHFRRSKLKSRFGNVLRR